jgi:glutamate-1-semialdehyde 2,1-aminomutase
MAGVKRVDRARVGELIDRERAVFAERHPRSRELFERGRSSLLGGVPMTWMLEWAGGFPVFMDEAFGARVRDVDGHTYVDLCLGDTGAMTGHAPPAAVTAIAERMGKGITAMLPTEDALWVGEELGRRFGVPLWQFTLTATDANRFAVRIAREITGRPNILVFNYCYHGTVDETFIALDENGTARSRPGNVGPPVDPTTTSKVVEFNDVAAVEEALAEKDVACVLTEPALTNIGIVLPDSGFHEALRETTRRTGTLLIIDETHTISAGPAGYTGVQGLEPDVVTLGKPIGSGVPGGAFGVTEEVADRMFARTGADYQDVGGIGGTLAGNALSLAAMRVTLDRVLTDDAYRRMIPLAERFTEGVDRVIAEHSAPWHVTRLGCRAEYLFHPDRPRNGGQAAANRDPDLDALVHLYLLNRRILMTPFHNMALMSPATTEGDVDAHTEAFAAFAADVLG